MTWSLLELIGLAVFGFFTGLGVELAKLIFSYFKKKMNKERNHLP